MRLLVQVSALLALGVLAKALDASANDTTTVYRTVDEQGVVSFSDEPPVVDAAEELTIEVPAQRDDPAARQRLEAMRETTDRMAADRREREKHRAEMREIAARDEDDVEAQSRPPTATDYDWYYPATGINYYPWRPVRPPRHHWPPQQRPPLAPGIDTEAWSRSHNSQLMRPILPRGR